MMRALFFTGLCALALAAKKQSTGTIQDMEHIIIFMQENRAFDHYYGSLNGVRGFNDRAAPPLPNGNQIFMQPAGDGYILPFNLNFNKTAASCMNAPEMDYSCDINIFNGGRMDAWNTARSPGFGMSYFNRSDLPYYYALADAFTIGDQYFQSTFTATNPNRLHLFSGSNGLSVNNSGYCELDDSEPLPGFNWVTYAESLQAANVSWRVIQELDNFDDNALEWFATFRESLPGTPLFDQGIMPVLDLAWALEDMLASDTLPSVLWIVGPTALSEHATNHPADGEWLSSELLAVLANPAYADVYAKTAFIINYDEGGQFFDHHWTPVPPMSPADGKSTVTAYGELTLQQEFFTPPGYPIGLGFRVPLFIVSPWTRGHLVYSEISDHVSVIKLIEARFNVTCPNISPWRRAVTSDLTAAFDFTAPDYSWPTFPDTSQNVNQSKWECDNLPAPTLPAVQSMPTQEPGTRVSRPLPYEFIISDSVSSSGVLTINMDNTGTAGAFFIVFDLFNMTNTPRKYTVEAGKSLSDEWPVGPRGYNYSLHGPNGFVRFFTGTVTPAVSAGIAYDKAGSAVVVSVALSAAGGQGKCLFTLTDNAYGTGGPWALVVAAGGAAASQNVSVAAVGNWYDLTVTVNATAGCPVSGPFSRRFMGRMENGKYTTSDPAMAAGSPFAATQYDMVPESHRTPEKWSRAKNCQSRRSRMKDACFSDEDVAAMIARHKLDEL